MKLSFYVNLSSLRFSKPITSNEKNKCCKIKSVVLKNPLHVVIISTFSISKTAGETVTFSKSCQKTTMLAGQQPSLNSSQGKSFSKEGQTSRSRSRGQNLWYHVKGLVTRNTHVQYESPITCGKKVMAKVKVFQK